MKDEINSDIASFVSDQEYSDYSDTASQSWTEDEFTGEEEEEEEEEYEEEEEEGDEDDYNEYDTEDDDYADVQNDSEAKEIMSEESDDESVFYENEHENAEEARKVTPSVRSSQSVESEHFVEAEEHLEFQNIAHNDEIFEALLPPPAFSDEVDDGEQISGSIKSESSETVSDEVSLQSEKLQPTSVDIHYDDATDVSEQSDYDDSEASDSDDAVINVEFETIKRNSIDLQENAVFIQQQLNKTTTVVVEKSSTELRDEVSPVVEIPNVERPSTSSDASATSLNTQMSPEEETIAIDMNLSNEVATTLNQENGEEQRNEVEEEEELEDEYEEEDVEEERIENLPPTKQNEEVTVTELLHTNETDTVAQSVTHIETTFEAVIPANEDITTSPVIHLEVETVVVPILENLTTPEIISVEETLAAETTTHLIPDKLTAPHNEAASTSSTAGTSMEARANQVAGSSKSSVNAITSNNSEEMLSASQSPSPSVQTELPKQMKNTTKPTKKIPVRKTSLALSGPFGAIRTNNVRAMQQELMNKSTEKPLPTKPSKIVPPKVYTKASITSLTERITKFIKPFSSASGSKEPVAVVKNVIPKKKYHETCFSDDNPSSESDEEPMPIRRQVPIRQLSMPNLMATQLSEEEESPEVRKMFY